LNFNAANEEEKLYKQAFLVFYKWYSRKHFPIHVLKTDKIGNKSLYLLTNKPLLYLPELTPKAQKKIEAAKKNV
jgi:hypothetical protein